MAHKLFEKWINEKTGETAVQMFDYVGYFPNDEAADRYIDSVKKYRKEHKLPCE